MSSKTKTAKRAPSPSTGDKKPLGNEAKRATRSIFSEAAPPPMQHVRANRSGDAVGTNLCTVVGYVTRVDDKIVNGSSGPVSKRQINMIVTGIIAKGAQDVVRTGVEGEVYMFPSRAMESPETAETGADKDSKFKSKARELVVSPTQSVRKLSTFSSMFYKDGKDGADAPVMSCAPGMMIEISGVCVNAVTRGGVTNCYLNGGKITCKTSNAPSPGCLPEHMIRLCKQEKMQEWSAFAGSIAMKGFFDENHLSAMSDAQKQQAVDCQAMWELLVEGAADRLAIMAQGKDEAIAAQLNAHEQRIRATPPAKLASGDVSLFLTDRYDCTLMPVLQVGMSPWDRVPEFVKMLEGTAEEQASLPQKFTAPWVVNVAFQGKAINLDMRIAYVFNKDAAVEAFDKGDDGSPLLVTETAGAAMTLSLRDHGFKFGSLFEEKVKMACDAMLYTGDFAAFVKMSNVEDGGAEVIKTDFPEGGTIYLDVKSSLARHSVLVSEDFVKTNMCGGGTLFVPPRVSKDVEKLEFLQGVTEMPDLEEYGYQEITYDAFDIDNWSSLSGTIEYRVVHPGVRAALAANKDLASDSAKGEHHLKEQAGATSPAEMKQWLTGSCLVYARRA